MNWKKILGFAAMAVPLALALPGCKPKSVGLSDWREELVVIVPPPEHLDAGFAHELVRMFAEGQGVNFRELPLPPDQVAAALENGKAHFSAFSVRANDADNTLKLGKPFQITEEQLVCRDPQPQKAEAMIGRQIVVTAGSTHEAALREAQKKLLSLKWETSSKMPDVLLSEVAEGQVDCTVASEEQVATMRNFHPNMDAALDVASPAQLAWAFASDGDDELIQATDQFILHLKKNGDLRRLTERYYGHNERLRSLDAAAFLKDVEALLPRYRAAFEDVSQKTGLEWELLAAIAYRESHWDPHATSPTGVRGMMMLTEDTASRMFVKNRLNASESLLAGALYLELLRSQMPERIEEPSRTWLALAAYNQGIGHLEDARTLAKQRGLDPDSWMDVKKVMPHLSNPELAENTKHGQARGGEAVIFVETVRLYRDMLKRLTAEPPPYRNWPPHLRMLVEAAQKPKPLICVPTR